MTIRCRRRRAARNEAEPASRAAAEFGPGRVGRVLAAMAAAAVAAQVDDGWEESVRREALYSVLHGPMDWTTEAAIRALTYLACQ